MSQTISKQVLDKQSAREAEEKLKKEKAEADLLNAIAKEVYDLLEAKEINVRQVHKILKGMLDALDHSFVAKLNPLKKVEEEKTLKAFYEEPKEVK